MKKVQDKWVEQGFCDERGAGFCANVVRFADNFGPGMVLLCVRGNMLNIHDVDMQSNAGELLYQVELKKVENLKTRNSMFFGVLKFTYEGRKFAFNNFYCKEALKVIREESEK